MSANYNGAHGGGVYNYAELSYNSPPQVVIDAHHYGNSAPEVVPPVVPDGFVKQNAFTNWDEPSNSAQQPPAKRPWLKRRRLWAAIAVLVCIIIAAVVGGVVGSRGNESDNSEAPTTTGPDSVPNTISHSASSATSDPTASSTADPTALKPADSATTSKADSPSTSKADAPSTSTADTATSLTSEAPAAESSLVVRAVLIPWSSDKCSESKPAGEVTITDGDCHELEGKSLLIDQFADDCVIYKFKNEDCSGGWYRHVTEKACFPHNDYVSFNITCY